MDEAAPAPLDAAQERAAAGVDVNLALEEWRRLRA
jgi:hypothetical protein